MKVMLFFLLLSQFSLFQVANERKKSNGLSKQDAEKILGQSVKLTTNKKETNGGVIRTDITYTGLQNDSKTNRTVNIYYSQKKYKNASLAKNAYATIVKSNVNMPGQTSLNEIGDEAWYHSDSENFSLLMIRKNEYLLLVKVNKMTNKFSRIAFEKILKRIVLVL